MATTLNRCLLHLSQSVSYVKVLVPVAVVGSVCHAQLAIIYQMANVLNRATSSIILPMKLYNVIQTAFLAQIHPSHHVCTADPIEVILRNFLFLVIANATKTASTWAMESVILTNLLNYCKSHKLWSHIPPQQST